MLLKLSVSWLTQCRAVEIVHHSRACIPASINITGFRFGLFTLEVLMDFEFGQKSASVSVCDSTGADICMDLISRFSNECPMFSTRTKCGYLVLIEIKLFEIVYYSDLSLKCINAEYLADTLLAANTNSYLCPNDLNIVFENPVCLQCRPSKSCRHSLRTAHVNRSQFVTNSANRNVDINCSADLGENMFRLQRIEANKSKRSGELKSFTTNSKIVQYL